MPEENRNYHSSVRLELGAGNITTAMLGSELRRSGYFATVSAPAEFEIRLRRELSRYEIRHAGRMIGTLSAPAYFGDILEILEQIPRPAAIVRIYSRELELLEDDAGDTTAATVEGSEEEELLEIDPAELEAGETIAGRIAEELEDRGITEPSSSSPLGEHDWFSAPELEADYRTGNLTERSAHLEGMAPEIVRLELGKLEELRRRGRELRALEIRAESRKQRAGR